MAPESHQRVRQLFDEALERPEAERLPFVETACAGDQTLFQAVERLLRARVASESFLENDFRNTHRIGRYLIRRELGRGAMGVVYDAVDPLIGRSVAVKVIRLKEVSEPGEAEFLRERLFREARSAGQLFHPGIVIILDVGREGDSAFIAMECVDGPTLQQILASGRPIRTQEAIRILQQTAAALDYAHQHGIVHRDIKPANIMLQGEVTVKVADFGIAKIMSGHTTVTGVVMGTPSYMSPEQLEARAVDGRSDQFSLAVVAYELLTRSRPFEADSMATLAHLIVYGERRSARAANPSLPAGVDEVFQRGLGRSPEERFGSCTEFVTALDAALNQPMSVMAEAPALESAPVAEAVVKRKVPRSAYLIGIAAMIVATAVVAFFSYRSLYVRPQPIAVKAKSRAVVNVVPASVKKEATPPIPEADVRATALTNAPPKAVPASVRAQQLYAAAVAKRREGRLEEATVLLREAAELGDATAMEELGESYRDGEGVAQDESEALRWFERSAHSGNSSAMVSLGATYLLGGDGVEANDEEALRWFEKAAARHNPAGIYDLGTMYEGGRGVPESMDKAKELYERAAELGNGEARRRLAKLEGR